MASVSHYKISVPLRFFFLFFLIVGSLGGVALFIYFAPQNYQAIVVSGEPVLIVLQKPKGQKPVIFSLPADTYIEGVHGYGAYSLSALWKLGTLDKRGGMLLADSLSDSLGLPVTRYLESSSYSADLPLAMRQLFGWNQVHAFMTGRLHTNIRFGELIGIVKQLSNARLGEIKTMSLGNTTLFEKVALPDGSIVSKVDPDRIDPIMGEAFENEDIRFEAKRIAVVNTTDVMGLGSTIAKVLSHVGAVVVSVSNAPTPIEQCRLESSKAESESLTVRFIQSMYHCELNSEGEASTADIRLLVGTEYAKRFTK